MPGMEQFDYTHAIFAGLTSIWRRLFIFISVGLLAHFVGGNIYAAPGFLASIQSTGLNAFSTLRAVDLAWLPLEWVGTILMSLTHLLTAPFAFIFGMAFLASMSKDDVPFWVFVVLIVGQPLDTFFVSYFNQPLSGGALIIGSIILGIYTSLSIGGCYLWWRLREAEEFIDEEDEAEEEAVEEA